MNKGDVMQKQTIKQLGKQMREKFSLPDDLPSPIRKALERLADTEVRGTPPQGKSMCQH
jgi:hypothetical protein